MDRPTLVKLREIWGLGPGGVLGLRLGGGHVFFTWSNFTEWHFIKVKCN